MNGHVHFRELVDRTLHALSAGLRSQTPGASEVGRPDAALDPQGQLKALLTEWDSKHRDRVPRGVKTKVHELLDLRNKWAHPTPTEPLEWGDAYRAVDSARALLEALGIDASALSLLESEVLGTRPTQQKPLPGPQGRNLAELWLGSDPNGPEVMRGTLRCPECKQMVAVSVRRNPQAITDKRPRFLLFEGSEPDGRQVGHLFLGTRFESPVLYYGGLQHCGEEVRVKVFFNRSYNVPSDSHVVVLASGGRVASGEIEVPF